MVGKVSADWVASGQHRFAALKHRQINCRQHMLCQSSHGAGGQHTTEMTSEARGSSSQARSPAHLPGLLLRNSNSAIISQKPHCVVYIHVMVT